MTRRLTPGVLMLGLILPAAATGVSAQQAPAPAAPAQAAAATAPAPKSRMTPLKLQLVVSRYLGEKKISNMPYTLWLTSDDQMMTNLRMGVDVPVNTTVTSGTGPAVPSYSYRDVGTSIDALAATTDAGFKVVITLRENSVQFDPKEESTIARGLANAPAFRTFVSKFSILLRDGQTAQYTTATDPISGEVMKVDATLNVVK